MDFNICANCKYFIKTDDEYMFGNCIKEYVDNGLDSDEIHNILGPIGDTLGDDYMCEYGEFVD